MLIKYRHPYFAAPNDKGGGGQKKSQNDGDQNDGDQDDSDQDDSDQDDSDQDDPPKSLTLADLEKMSLSQLAKIHPALQTEVDEIVTKRGDQRTRADKRKKDKEGRKKKEDDKDWEGLAGDLQDANTTLESENETLSSANETLTAERDDALGAIEPIVKRLRKTGYSKGVLALLDKMSPTAQLAYMLEHPVKDSGASGVDKTPDNKKASDGKDGDGKKKGGKTNADDEEKAKLYQRQQASRNF